LILSLPLKLSRLAVIICVCEQAMAILLKCTHFEEDNVSDNFVSEVDKYISEMTDASFLISVQQLFGAKVLFEYFIKTHLKFLNFNLDFKLPLFDILKFLSESLA
jgi:hypothetical protein